jgi:hypothetical protein
MVFCNSCGFGVNEAMGLNPSLRRPCPNCGSTSRHFSVNIQASVLGNGSISTRLILKETERLPPAVKRREALPRFGELLLYCFLARTERINLIGDLFEDYREAIAKFGRKSAVCCFYAEVARSLLSRLSWRFFFKIGFISGGLKVLIWVFKLIAKIITG